MTRSQGKRRKWAVVAAVLLAYGLVGFFVLPPIVKSQAEKRLSSELGRTVTLGKVSLNPFLLSVAIEGFDVREKNPETSFLGWDRLYVRFDALRSVAGAWVLGDVNLQGFHAGVVINPDGSFNFSDLLAKFAAPKGDPGKPGRPVLVGHMEVGGARVDFSDRSLATPFKTTVGPLTFALSGFETSGSRGAPYHFEASTESGERFALTGTLSADPVASKGTFEATDLVIRKYTPYFERSIQADVTSGTLTARGRYELNFDPKARVVALEEGEVHLKGLAVAERAKAKPVVELASIDVTGIHADAVGLAATVERVALSGGKLHLSRDKSGAINVLALVPPSAGRPAAATPGPMPRLSVGQVEMRTMAVDLYDEGVANPARLSLGNLAFGLKDFSLEKGAKMPLSLSFDWAPKGAVAVEGTVSLKPEIAADLKATVSGFSLLPLSPYLEQFVNARLTQGTLSTAVTVRISLAGKEPAISLNGDFSAEKVGLVDKAHDKDLVGFTRLSLSGISAKTSPSIEAFVASVELSGPYARVIVNPNGTPNLATLAVASQGKPSPAAPQGPLPKVEIGRVTIDGGDFSFADRSVEPNVRVALTSFAGTVTGLSSENLARGDVNLYGMVDGVGPLDITGKLDPLGPQKFVDLKVDVKSVDLVPLSPYTGKFAGYELARGQLVVDTRILLDGAKLDTSNKVTLNQFNFGAPTGSKDATHLPVRLAVALLKDVNGQIFIDIPVQGSLDDPEFRVGKVVWRVVGNLLTKVAVSPFSLVGAMFGGGGEELAYQEFAPGGSDFVKDDLAKLETLGKALANRPALSLGIEGGFDPAADAYALKRLKLEHLVRRQVWEARHAADPNIAPPEQLVVTAQENAAMVKKLFDAKFPPGTTFGTPLPAPPAPVPPPSGSTPGLHQAHRLRGHVPEGARRGGCPQGVGAPEGGTRDRCVQSRRRRPAARGDGRTPCGVDRDHGKRPGRARRPAGAPRQGPLGEHGPHLGGPPVPVQGLGERGAGQGGSGAAQFPVRLAPGLAAGPPRD